MSDWSPSNDMRATVGVPVVSSTTRTDWAFYSKVEIMKHDQITFVSFPDCCTGSDCCSIQYNMAVQVNENEPNVSSSIKDFIISILSCTGIEPKI
jgi:hypothetical protein